MTEEPLFPDSNSMKNYKSNTMFENPFKPNKREQDMTARLAEVKTQLAETEKQIASLEHYIESGGAALNDRDQLEQLRTKREELETLKIALARPSQPI